MLRHTPFHQRTAQLCHSYDWRRWAGYVVASKYELTIEREYHAVRNAAALIDVSPLFKYLVWGPDAVRLVDRLIPRDVTRLRPGRVIYTPWCDDEGKVIDDGTVARLAPDRFRITAADPNIRWFEENAVGLDVTVEDASDRIGALALQGPLARAILEQVTADPIGRLRYFRRRATAIDGRPVDVSRTGYTGDLGYEIWCEASDAVGVWDAIVAAGRDYGLLPAGMLALDIARIEAGLLLVDVDYVPAPKARLESQKSSPFELNLGWTVRLDEGGPFNGRAALAAEAAAGSAWQTVGIVVDWDALESAYARVGLPAQVPHTAWRTSIPLYDGRREVGYATSGCFSPLLKQYIALATVRSDVAEYGTELALEITVEHMRRRALARVTELPFFDPPRKKAVIR